MRRLIKKIYVVWWENLFAYLLWMVGAMFIFLYVFANIASGEEEDMTWDASKQEFVFTKKDNKKVDKKTDNDGWVIGGQRSDATNQPPTQRGAVTTSRPPQHPWERYLPITVRNGKRQATQWEITEAQRKHWAKGIKTQRAIAVSQQRTNLIAYRKATGWYAQRRVGPGNGIANMHMRSVANYVNSGGYGYSNHSPGCAQRRGHANPISRVAYRPPTPSYIYANQYPAYTYPPTAY